MSMWTSAKHHSVCAAAIRLRKRWFRHLQYLRL